MDKKKKEKESSCDHRILAIRSPDARLYISVERKKRKKRKLPTSIGGDQGRTPGWDQFDKGTWMVVPSPSMRVSLHTIYNRFLSWRMLVELVELVVACMYVRIGLGTHSHLHLHLHLRFPVAPTRGAIRPMPYRCEMRAQRAVQCSANHHPFLPATIPLRLASKGCKGWWLQPVGCNVCAAQRVAKPINRTLEPLG